MKMSPSWLCAVSALAILSTAGVAAACIHPETGQPGVRAQAQEYTVVHARGRQTLLISTQITLADGAAVPQALSLVTATPTLPDVYQTGDPALFDDLYGWFNQALSNDPVRGGADGPGSNGVEVLPRVEAGPYGITPIMASGAEGATALNNWLTENGFETVDRALAQPYVDRGWYFLAVDIQPAADDEGLGEGRLPPLHLEFDSPEVVLPLKLEGGMGAFDVRIYLFLQGALPDEVAGRYGLERGQAGSEETRPESVTALLNAASQRTGAPAANFEAFELHSDEPINTDDAPLSAWPDDFAFEPPDEAQILPNPDGMGGMAAGGVMGGEGGSMAAGGTEAPSTPSADDAEDDGGCAASPTHGPATPWVVAFLLLLTVRRRR